MLGSLHCFIYATNQLRALEPTNTISNYEVLDQTQWLVLAHFFTILPFDAPETSENQRFVTSKVSRCFQEGQNGTLEEKRVEKSLIDPARSLNLLLHYS